MPESIQQMVHAQRQYSRELDENQNARLRKSDAAFHFQGPGQQAHLRVLYQQQQARAAAAHPAPPVIVDYIAFAWSLAVIVGVPALILRLVRRVPSRAAPAAPPQTSSSDLPYHAAPSLLTPTESQFYAALQEAIGPMAVIQCKVRLADLLLTAPHDLAAFRRVSQKHVDFVLCDRATLRPFVAVELDDRSHERGDRMRRDAFVDRAYAQAGLPLVHLPVQEQYSAAQLLGELQQFL